ncbi:MAG: hypothetical protein QM667_13565, partial [Asticcacaulis sp.]
MATLAAAVAAFAGLAALQLSSAETPNVVTWPFGMTEVLVARTYQEEAVDKKIALLERATAASPVRAL